MMNSLFLSLSLSLFLLSLKFTTLCNLSREQWEVRFQKDDQCGVCMPWIKLFSGTIVRNSSRLSSRLTATASIQKRFYATETAPSAKKFSKWSMLKNGIKIGLVGGISYGCYGKQIHSPERWGSCSHVPTKKCMYKDIPLLKPMWILKRRQLSSWVAVGPVHLS